MKLSSPSDLCSIPARMATMSLAYPMLMIGIWQQIFNYWAKQMKGVRN